ncbi:uncharacterized protein [Epargyreus clarus]|uniref:uncharacterized protein n=1 Tax=Epargyreus clarus TaxID=520877 RepID=UPI003C2B3C58
MPEDSKKQQKGRNDPKDQRRRRGRQPAGPVEKKPEKQPEAPKEPEKPAYEPPGPEFYRNLKRETDEILKITEEASTKYKKKEIQSNWAKYEMPVETYEDIDEQENMGADYEKLIEASVSTGGHFQFKHEKSWDTESGPSLYDKYFDINMDLLTLAISTIPFYERNSIDQSLFNENDIVSMNHRATKFKQKYYNDKKFNTPELEAQDKILKSLSSQTDKQDMVKNDASKDFKTDDHAIREKPLDLINTTLDKNIENIMKLEKEPIPAIASPVKEIKVTKQVEKETKDLKQVEEIDFRPNVNKTSSFSSPIKEIKELKQVKEVIPKADDYKVVDEKDLKDGEMLFSNENNENVVISNEPEIDFTKVDPPKQADIVEHKPAAAKEVTTPVNPVIQSPEDLEKWLDDFLDD